MLQGVDTSVFQGAVNEAAMQRAGIDFRYIKLGEGGDFIDASSGARTDSNQTKLLRLTNQVASIRAHGMVPGGYHFLRARADRTGATEMDFALRLQRLVALGQPGDLRLAIDIEKREDMNALDGTNAQIAQRGAPRTRAYLVSAIRRHIEQKGYAPVLYSFPSYLRDLLRGASSAELAIIAKCPLWHAEFGVVAPHIVTPFTQTAIWQNTSKAVIGGENPADFNVADERRFQTALVPSATPVPVDPVDPAEPIKDVDVRRLQMSLNAFTERWLCDVTPLRPDGVKGPMTNRRIMTVKFYLGYGKTRDAKVTSKFVRRMRHPRDPRFSTPRMIATGIARRRRRRKVCAAAPPVPGFTGASLYDGKIVPTWTVEYLDAARHYTGPGGPWRGVVVSGIRTPAHSVELCRAMCGASSCPGRCAGLSSNHNATPPVVKCEGALDVTDFLRFGQIMRAIGAPLRNDLPRDLVHFSCSGH